jgi:hypothetical protein
MIHLITSFYYVKEINEKTKNRNNELLECLKQNILSKDISKIYLFVDNQEALNVINNINNIIGYEQNKVNVISIGKQPLYSELFEFAFDFLKGKICMISNSDIYMYECDMNCIKNISDNIFAITRYEHDMSCPHIDNNNEWSCHDAFIFRSPLNKKILENYHHTQNLWGAENSVIDTLIHNGYKVYNPCYQIKIKHLHQSDLRDNNRQRIKGPEFNIPPSIYVQPQYDINPDNVDDLNNKKNIDVNTIHIDLYCDNLLFNGNCREENCTKNHDSDIYKKLWYKYMMLLLESPYAQYIPNINNKSDNNDSTITNNSNKKTNKKKNK